MLELLTYLRANGFKTFIVSGGGIEFMRPWTERVYGIPPEQVVGSGGGLKYELRDGNPVILKLPELVHNDDKAGTGPRFCLYVHHTDAEREWAYDREFHIGKLDKGLDAANTNGWTVVKMKDDWKTIFPVAK